MITRARPGGDRGGSMFPMLKTPDSSINLAREEDPSAPGAGKPETVFLKMR
jgi:hypothetical protein